MSKKKDLKEMLSVHHRSVRKLLENVTEEESMYRPGQQINHIRWLAGHICGGAEAILKHLGSEDQDPHSWGVLFDQGSVVDDNPSAYPTIAEIRDHLHSVYDSQHRLLDEMSAREFDLKVDSEDEEGGNSPLRSIQFLCSHEFYHLGQIMNIRRLQGQDRAFG